MKIDAKMDRKSDPKIDVWALEGPTFEVSGGFLRSQIFDEFSIGKKSAKNRENGGPRGSQKGVRWVFLGRPGGMCGAAGEVRRG